MAPLRNLTEDEVFFDLIDEMSPGKVFEIQTPFLYVLMRCASFLRRAARLKIASFFFAFERAIAPLAVTHFYRDR